MPPEAPQPEQARHAGEIVDVTALLTEAAKAKIMDSQKVGEEMAQAAASNADKATEARKIIESAPSTEPIIDALPEGLAPVVEPEVAVEPQQVEPMPGTLPVPEAKPAPTIIDEVPGSPLV